MAILKDVIVELLVQFICWTASQIDWSLLLETLKTVPEVMPM